MTKSEEPWSASKVPDQAGRTFVITGANSGIGLQAAKVLAARGAQVVMACRNLDKAKKAQEEILRSSPDATLWVVSLDLSDLDSVRVCSEEILERCPAIDVLINNAGIMAIPRRETAQGFEMQLGTNHLGHFALTGLLFPRLRETAQRVVTISSQAHRMGELHFDDLQLERSYGEWRSYGQSKLANLLFARELGRRFEGSQKVALAVHPGVIATNLGRHIGFMANIFFAVANPIALKDIPQGAATQCWAAVHPDAAAHNGAYLADCNPRSSSKHGSDLTLAARLWEESERIVSPWAGD